jgi:hypothetical protein
MAEDQSGTCRRQPRTNVSSQTPRRGCPQSWGIRAAIRSPSSASANPASNRTTGIVQSPTRFQVSTTVCITIHYPAPPQPPPFRQTRQHPLRQGGAASFAPQSRHCHHWAGMAQLGARGAGTLSSLRKSVDLSEWLRAGRLLGSGASCGGLVCRDGAWAMAAAESRLARREADARGGSRWRSGGSVRLWKCRFRHVRAAVCARRGGLVAR